MPVIFDNIENLLLQALKNTLEVSFRSDFCVGYFNLRGWKELADTVENFNGSDENCCRLLIGMQKPPDDLISLYFSTLNNDPIDLGTANKLKKEIAEHFRLQLTIGYPTDQDEIGLKKLSKQLKEGKVKVKLFLNHPLHAKLYLLFRNDKINPIIGYLGSSNLTLSGLANQGELNIDVLDGDAAKKLAGWFEDRWEDRWCIDISKELIEIIDESWAGEKLIPPYLIYLKIAYHLSTEARAGLNEFKIPGTFRNVLFKFQEEAVRIAAHHLRKRRGVLIGDVVGLGKTLIASALMKIFEEDYSHSTLVICPPNISPMWEDYIDKYDLKATVMSIGEVQKELKNLRRFRVIVIDESHNLINREGKRYAAIRDYIHENDPYVIMLTATPYNKSYKDLSNQLRLFIGEDDDIGISPDHYIQSIGGKLQFSAIHQKGIRTLAAFERSDIPDDWRELMRLYLIRRTRSFIKTNYADVDNDNNRKFLYFSDGTKSYFPDRIPQKIDFGFDNSTTDDIYANLYSQSVVDILNELLLPRYGLGQDIYLANDTNLTPTKEEKLIWINLSRAGKRLKGFCRTNLFKRLESSGHSFLVSIYRHILRNNVFLYAIEKDLPLPIGDTESANLEDLLDDKDFENIFGDAKTETELENNFSIYKKMLFKEASISIAEKIYKEHEKYHNKFAWIRPKLFSSFLKTHLTKDNESLISILNQGVNWTPKSDRKLVALYKFITKQYQEDKILIFTQYADTAKYLHEEIVKLQNESTSDGEMLKIEYVTGHHKNPTAIAHRFSPVSNEKKNPKNFGFINDEDEIRVLISTDVLSEGQNLQDCHIIINYDLPWAIIRLIQRVGRVDRIGQQSEKIFCYSFLPEQGIDDIIYLRKRLKTRLNENAEVVGTDEIFFEDEKQYQELKDLYNEKMEILSDEDDKEVDLASQAFQIWSKAIKDDPKLKKLIPELPNVIFSTKEIADNQNPGVLVYTKTADDNDVLAWVNPEGEIISQSQFEILKAAECKPDTPALNKIKHHHELVQKGVEHIKEFEKTIIGGALGSRTGAKYKVYMRLIEFYEKYKESLFVNQQLRKALDDIYVFPFKENAKETLNRQLKLGINDTDLAELVVSLYEEDKLTLNTDKEKLYREPQIICSMGLKKTPEFDRYL